MHAPFRADHAGSLLRPTELREASGGSYPEVVFIKGHAAALLRNSPRVMVQITTRSSTPIDASQDAMRASARIRALIVFVSKR